MTKQEWKIGDCLELLPELEDNIFDMVLTSPPFKNEDVEDDDYWSFYDKFFKESIRVAKNLVVIIHSATKMNHIIKHYPPKRVLIWGKGVVQYSWRYNPIYVYQIGDHYKVNKYIWSDAFGIPPLQGSIKVHKYQDPVVLYTTLLKMFKDNQTVLDPFLGSGTTLEACRKANKNCLGIEKDPQWEHLYPERCMSHTPQLETYIKRSNIK